MITPFQLKIILLFSLFAGPTLVAKEAKSIELKTKIGTQYSMIGSGVEFGYRIDNSAIFAGIGTGAFGSSEFNTSPSEAGAPLGLGIRLYEPRGIFVNMATSIYQGSGTKNIVYQEDEKIISTEFRCVFQNCLEYDNSVSEEVDWTLVYAHLSAGQQIIYNEFEFFLEMGYSLNVFTKIEGKNKDLGLPDTRRALDLGGRAKPGTRDKGFFVSIGTGYSL